MAVAVARFEVYLVSLNPTVGSEIQKTRPCVVISPPEMNRHSAVFIVAPMTSGGRPRPTRLACEFQGVSGFVVLDQIRAVDRSRLVKRIGALPPSFGERLLALLREMFEV